MHHCLAGSLLWATGLFTSSAHAQTYLHTAFWLRFAPTYTLNAHWSLLAEGLYRRQSNLAQGLANPLASPYLMAGRVGVAYRTGRWTYTLFPAVYYYSSPALGKPADLQRPNVPEWRPYVQAEWTMPLLRGSSLRLRAIYELRLFTAPDVVDMGRFRARVAYRRGLGKHTYAQLWNETLFYAPPNLPTTGQRFEINRTNLALGVAVSNASTLEIGYQFAHRQQRALVEFDDEHALTATLFWAINRHTY